ncbi:IS66 family insertion sequence element accessory protein TnpB [Rhizobium alarense]|uniref:IS66 family insertion sequence element accessory protein TnpB n=1 Tax=Rhizobium alarense TaxID=2846851 RepID=UPI0038B681B7
MDGSGIVLAYKRLEEHTFTWPGIKDGLMTLTHAQSKPSSQASIGGGFMPSRRAPRRPSNSCGTMTQHDKFQRQIGSGVGSFAHAGRHRSSR